MALRVPFSFAPFTTSGVTEDAKNTDLTIYLVDLLEAQRNPTNGVWHTEGNLLRTLSNTCQVVDAAHQLQLPRVSTNLVTTAVQWLIDLPLPRVLEQEEQARVRIHPGRFKTLAAMNRFEGKRLYEHFSELSRHLNLQTGSLQEVAVEDLKPPLRTMIWLDTLWYLEQHGIEIQTWRAGREIVLEALAEALASWLDAAVPAPRFVINNDGDASYALDLLLRHKYLTPDDATTRQAFERLAAAMRQRRSRVMRNADAIYCGIQICAHLTVDDPARETVGAFIREVRERYLNQGYTPELVSFHALVLRLLASYYDTRLERMVFETNWLRRRAALDAESRLANERQAQELVKLLQHTFEIRIAAREELSSSRSHNQVLRLQFGFKTDAADAGGNPMETGSDHLRLIVKRGPLLALTQALHAYTNLPDELKEYFVKHTSTLHPSDSSDPLQLWYLVMEDLARWKSLDSELDRLETAGWGRQVQEELARIVNAVIGGLGAIHRSHMVPGGSEALERLYLTPLDEQIKQLSEPTAFPVLKSFKLNGFIANQQTYRRFNSYLETLRNKRRELTPPRLGRTHGDCHSRNLMLSADLRKIKFIDLENLAMSADYLADYALLFEDVAFYRFIQHDERALLEQAHLALPGDTSEESSQPIRHPTLSYNPFPINSQVAVDFQSELLTRIEAFAQTLNDTYWKERLWLAIACSLVLLSTRQMLMPRGEASNRARDQRRQSNELRFVLVSYAEAMRLLDELVTHLETGASLQLPFAS